MGELTMDCSLFRKLKDKIIKHHWKVLNILCCAALFWQLFGIFNEWLRPSQETIRITEKNLEDIDFPLTMKICPDSGFNLTALREEGYDSAWFYFIGQSRYNSSIFGWAGHTNTSETRGTVEQIYHNVVNFPTPETFIDRMFIWDENDSDIPLSSAKVRRPNFPLNCFTLELGQHEKSLIDGISISFLPIPGIFVEILLEDKRLSCDRLSCDIADRFFSSGSRLRVDLGQNRTLTNAVKLRENIFDEEDESKNCANYPFWEFENYNDCDNACRSSELPSNYVPIWA